MNELVGNERITSAIAFLTARRFDSRAACKELGGINIDIEMLLAFKTKFPVQFGKLVDTSRPLNRIDELKVGLRFVELINHHIFPVCDWFEDSCEESGELLGPDIEGMQPDYYYESPKDRPLVANLIEVWFDKYTDEYAYLVKAGMKEADLAKIESGMKWSRAEDLCAQYRSPMRDAAMAVRVFTKETGNPFIDMGWEERQEIQASWCVSDIDWLQSEYSEAKCQMAAAMKFSKWLEKDYRRVGVFRRLLIESGKQDERPQTLVEVLSEVLV